MTRKSLIFLLSTLGLLLLPLTSFAHIPGQPPFIKINGKECGFYPVLSSSLQDLNLAQDNAPEKYLVGQKIDFEIEINNLPAPPDVIRKAKYTWHFGDGQTSTGLTNVHYYDQMGSYVLTIFIDTGLGPKPDLLDSIFIDVLPDNNYQLPVSKFSVNGSTQDTVSNLSDADIQKGVKFDSSLTKAGTAPIVSYLWDFGDTNSSQEKAATHSFDPSLLYIFPILRVKDSNGFISDSTVEIDRADAVQARQPKPGLINPPPGPTPQTYRKYIYWGIGGVILIGIAFFVFKKLKK